MSAEVSEPASERRSEPRALTLPDWLADPGLQPLWSVVHERLEQRGPSWRGRAGVAIASPAERRALSSLLGRALPGDRVTVDVADLDARTANAGGLLAVVEQAVGEVVDRRSVRSLALAQREAPVEAARAVLPESDWVGAWLDAVRRTGPTVDEAVAAAGLLHRLVMGHERVSRQDLAAGTTGDAHALDDGTVLASLVLRGLALATGTALPQSAGGRRALWDAAGVVLDGVSSSCLVLRLPVSTGGRLAVRLADGEPLHVTARDLGDGEVRVAPGTQVLVCENPRVLEAVADGGLAVPVVCANGNPNLVVMDLLASLSRSGAELRYHGDFDWPGLAIANRLVAAVGVEPWLMTAADYDRAAGGSSLALRGQPVEASWDPALRTTMAAGGVAVHEEAVLEDLLRELARLADR